MLKIVFSEDYKCMIKWTNWFRLAYLRALQDVQELTEERDSLQIELRIADKRGIKALLERDGARDLARKFHTQLERKICKC